MAEDIRSKKLDVLQIERIHILKAMAVYETSLMYGFLKYAPGSIRMEAWRAYQGHRNILAAIDLEIARRLELEFGDMFN